MTPREFDNCLKGYQKRIENKYKSTDNRMQMLLQAIRLNTTWITNASGNLKRPVKPDEIFKIDIDNEQLTDDETEVTTVTKSDLFEKFKQKQEQGLI